LTKVWQGLLTATQALGLERPSPSSKDLDGIAGGNIISKARISTASPAATSSLADR